MFFTPTADFIDDPPSLADSAPQEETPATPVESAPNDGSLGIGSLKGTP
jgi:putative iron-dependent peroxidase